MRASRLGNLFGQGALKALANLGGGTTPATWAIVFIVLAILATVEDQISEFSRTHLKGYPWVFVPVLVLVAVLASFRGIARKASRELKPRAEIEEKPHPVKALILFLSATPDRSAYERITSRLDNKELGVQLGKLAWRMPIAAIAHHAARLERVIALVSPGENGSSKDFASFKELITRLLPPNFFFAIETSGEFLRGRED